MVRLPMQPIPRCPVGSITYPEFLSRYVKTTTPLILEGAGDGWPAAREWTVEHLLARADPDEEVVLETQGEAPTTHALARVPVVLSEIRAPSPDRSYKIYLSNWSFLHCNRAWADDYSLPAFFARDRAATLTGHDEQLKWLFIGEDGTGSAMHMDVVASSAWLYVFCGRKHWRLLRSRSASSAFRTERSAVSSLFADLDGADLGEGAVVFDGVQEPGDLIFVPSPILHEVKNIGTTLALTHNFVDCSDLVLVADDVLTFGALGGEHHLDGAAARVQRDYLALSDEERAAVDEVMRAQLSGVRSAEVRPLLERAGFPADVVQ